MKKRMILGILLVEFCFICLGDQVSGAEAYPTKPIDIIVAARPGGGADICARLIAKYLQQTNPILVNVVNKPAAAGIAGTREVMIATPDGYTMLLDDHGRSTILGASFEAKDLPFDWRNRTWIAITDKDTLVYLVKYDSPWKTLKDIAEYAQKTPEKFRWGTVGRHGISNPAMGQFFLTNNIPIGKLQSTHIAFNSTPDALLALASGNVDFCAQQVAESYALIEGKKVRPVVVVFEKRLRVFPDVPTVAEAGYPTLDVTGWHGISGPPGLPKHVVDFWVSSLEKASKDPVFIDMFENIHKVSVFLGPKEVKEYVEKEYQKYVEIAKYLGWKK